MTTAKNIIVTGASRGFGVGHAFCYAGAWPTRRFVTGRPACRRWD